MMQIARWTAEVAIMQQRFPSFVAFRTVNGAWDSSDRAWSAHWTRVHHYRQGSGAKLPGDGARVYIYPRIAAGHCSGTK